MKRKELTAELRAFRRAALAVLSAEERRMGPSRAFMFSIETVFTCPLCGGTARVAKNFITGHRYAECDKCGTTYQG